MNINDPIQLRKKIAELENENKKLREAGPSSSGAFGGSMKMGG